MEIDRNDVEVLAPEECLRLLTRTATGRVALHVRALPTVVPVGFVLTPDGIVVSTPADAWFGGAIRDAVVAFEADDVDPADGSRWSVVVVGVAADADGIGPLERRQILADLGTWPHVDGDALLRISFGMVQGRRVPVAVAADRAAVRPAA